MKSFKISFILLFVWIMTEGLQGQRNHFIQFDLHAGRSLPVQNYKSTYMFAGQGLTFGGGFDYFFGRFGIGITAGYFTNPTNKLFTSYITTKYLEIPDFIQTSDWRTKFAVLGPTYKWSLGRFEFDLFAKAGISQVEVADLLYAKTFFNQSYDLYSFTGISDDYQFAWAAGTRIIFKPLYWLGIQLKADYFTTSYISKIEYNYTYRDATDGNRNGILEDAEYFESQKISKGGLSDVSVVNLNLGVILQLGKQKPMAQVKMIPQNIIDTQVDIDSISGAEEISQTDSIHHESLPIINLDEKPKNIDLVEKASPEPVAIEIPKNEIQQVEPVAVREDKSTESTITQVLPSTEVKIEEKTEEKLAELPVTTYDAPEAQYDAEAAEFLYKAGESYFATNDFENALPCFNKLKADPNYPRAKYMFALSLCSMGNCEEAKKEYKAFAKTYKESDARTLEIIFASHFERCSTNGKLIKDKIKNATTTPISKEYKIQFIAMKRPNISFPRLSSIGRISTEYYPNKAVYRYTLIGYDDLKQATEEVLKVRKMGFRDAFIAEYQNGTRVNTLYHAK